jgi:hypothetical protein
LQRTNAIERELAIVLTSRVLVKDDLSRIRPIAKAGKEILITVTIDIIEGNRHPASVRPAFGQCEQFPAGCQSAALNEAVPADVLKTIDKGFDAAFEQVQVSVAIEVNELIEVTRIDFASLKTFTEAIAVAHQTMVAAGLTEAGCYRVEVNGKVSACVVGHHEIEGELGHPEIPVDAMGHSISLAALAPRVEFSGFASRVRSGDFNRMFVKDAICQPCADQKLLKIDLDGGG